MCGCSKYKILKYNYIEVEILKSNLCLINVSISICSFLFFCENCQYVLMVQSQFMVQRQERSLRA